MTGYYRERLSAERLKRCYDIAGPRVKEYLKAEIEFVVEKLSANSTVLELGCGYGRILAHIAQKAGMAFGIDNSIDSLKYGREMQSRNIRIHLSAMNAIQLGFRDSTFDHVICIQNGISAFHVNQRDLIVESLRVTHPGGTVLFSSYSEKFWPYRLEWFERQAEEGLVGEIDYEKTGRGNIVCKDGFTATTTSTDGFINLTSELNICVKFEEVNESSLFCLITKK